MRVKETSTQHSNQNGKVVVDKVLKMTKENIGQFASYASNPATNVVISLIPALLGALGISSPLPSVLGGALATSIKEITTERKTDEKFNSLNQSVLDLEKLVKEIEKNIPFFPTSIQVKLADVVLIYVDQKLDEELSKSIEDALKIEKYNMSLLGVDDIISGPNDCIGINFVDSSTSAEVEEIVESVSKVLKDYGLRIKATACF